MQTPDVTELVAVPAVGGEVQGEPGMKVNCKNGLLSLIVEMLLVVEDNVLIGRVVFPVP